MHKKFSDEIPLLEWLVAAMGGLLVIVSFGFLGYRAMSEQEPPLFVVTVESIELMGTQRAVTVSVANRGGRPVAELSVHADGMNGRSKDAIVDYVPAGSSRRVTFLFDDSLPPSDYEFVVDSFTNP